MIRNPNIIDRLYLSQGDEDTIYIDYDKIPQQTIDGLRFLYKQFKRRKNGVILNDPFSFGRNIQICLFLKAVRPLLHRPILILCQEGNEQDWLDRFDTWTNESLFKEVAIETAKPYSDKMVLINTMVNLHLFCVREWSIIIVDGDYVSTPNPILKLPFKACFKIWNTSVDMKKNLDRFEEVYKWLYPRASLDKNRFIANTANGVDVTEKAILIDSLCEDVVLRRDDQNSAFESLHRACEKSAQKHVTTTRKIAPAELPLPPFRMVGNTSIQPVKRATVAPTAAATITVAPTTVTSTTIAPKAVTPTNEDSMMLQITHMYGDTTITPSNKGMTMVAPTTSTPSTSSVPTLTITKKNKDATGTKIKRSKPRIELETANNTLTPKIVLASLIEESPVVDDETSIGPFQDFTVENYTKNKGQNKSTEEREIIVVGETSDAVPPALDDKLEEATELYLAHDTLIEKVSAIHISTKGCSTASDKKATEPHTILTCKPVGEHNSSNKLLTDNKRSTSSISSDTSSGCSDNTERDKKSDRKMIKCKAKVSCDKPEVGITKIDLDELNKEMRDLDTTDKTEQIIKRRKITDSSEIALSYSEFIKKNEQRKQASVSCIKVNTKQVVNSLKRINVDVQMRQCEDIVVKKFKGSLLDRLF